jgi:4-aminobutyrate aminotransferase / (S)-3-amino-2-methylpropionate transaminase / 5-aminovalerate transaminase
LIETKHRLIRDGFKLYDYERDSIRYKYESDYVKPQSTIWWNSAKDFSIFDKDGNKWIDFSSGIFVANAGHSNTEINEAIKNQLDNDLVYSYQYYTEIRRQFTEKLLDCSPDHFEKVVLLNSGSEATDAAYRLIKIWAKKNNKKYIVSFNGSYHGRVLGSDLICGNKDSTEWSNIVDDDIVFIDFPYDKDTVFDPSLLPPPEQIAAFFIETYQGRTAQMYPKPYLQDLYNFAKEKGSLICFDEIQSGFYRMGKLYGYMTYGDYEPDIICLGKGMTSSLPMSAVLSTKELIDVDTNLSSTHAGNALCCAAGLANINYLTSEKFQKELSERVEVFKDRLRRLEQYGSVSHVNVRGMIAAIIFKDSKEADRVVEFCFNNGIFPVNTSSDSIKLGPPLTITVEAMNEAFDVLEGTL